MEAAGYSISCKKCGNTHWYDQDCFEAGVEALAIMLSNDECTCADIDCSPAHCPTCVEILDKASVW